MPTDILSDTASMPPKLREWVRALDREQWRALVEAFTSMIGAGANRSLMPDIIVPVIADKAVVITSMLIVSNSITMDVATELAQYLVTSARLTWMETLIQLGTSPN